MSSDTSTIKIDGIATSISSQSPVIIIELAGGIKTHTKSKLTSNTKNMYQRCMDMINNSEGKMSELHIVLYYGKY